MYRCHPASGLGRGVFALDFLRHFRALVLGGVALFGAFVIGIGAVWPLPGTRKSDWCAVIFGPLVAGSEPKLGGPDRFEKFSARARQLARARKFDGVLEILPEIDRQCAGVNDEEYFLELLAVARGLDMATTPAEADAANLWTVRKVYWKIFLTPCTAPEDDSTVIGLKSMLASGGFACGGLALRLNGDQFVALRRDAAALLFAFEASLRADIVPDYHAKPEQAVGSTARDTAQAHSSAQINAKERQREELTRNALENERQRRLQKALSELSNASECLVRFDFAYPPEEDRMASVILDRIPPSHRSKAEILADLSRDRRKYADVMEQMHRVSQAMPRTVGAPGR